MTYTQKQRDQYNHDRDLTCKKLDLTEGQYNTFRRLGQKLHKLYEEQCNGYQDAYGNWDEKATKVSEQEEQKLNDKGKELAKSLGLHIFFQTDPRGATIYLSKDPIEYDNYHRPGCECIY